MSGFIRCPSCGFCIGLYVEAYNNAKRVLLTEKLFNNNPEEYSLDKLENIHGSIPIMKDIFDTLGIKLMCCRTRLFTYIDFDRILS